MIGKRTVVTGLASICPLGNTLAETWSALLAGKSGIGAITLFDAADYQARIAGEVKNFDTTGIIPPKQARHMDRFTQLAVCASMQLMEDSGFTITEENAHRVGCLLGVGLGGLGTIEEFHSKLMSAGPNKISPFSIPKLISNMAPAQISMFTGAKGCNMVMTSACASGTHAIGYAFMEVATGRSDAVISGGAEATITPMGVSGFTAMKALTTTHNDEPEKASRPFDASRDGFVPGEGTGLLLLESLESAQARGARIYAEVVGFGTSDDAYHMTAPRDDAEGMARAMLSAIEDAGINPEDVDCINAHGTSTGLNDKYESLALQKVFGDHAKNLRISATKSQTGHLLGAAGGLEGVFSCMSLFDGMVPGTLNQDTPDPDCPLNYMGKGSEKYQPEYVLSNSFGFGGTNGCILFKRWNNA